jgi:DNA-directed RNA polymerase specialized sigma24 family protein
MLNFKNNINNFQCQISKKNQIKNKSDIEDKIIIELIKQAIKENSKTKQDKNFSILFKKYYNKVILFLIKNFKNLSKEDIEDIVSDVFLKTYNKIKLYDIQNTYFKSRFFKLAKNTAIDEIRQRKAKIN